MELQAKLLRVIQDKEFYRVGGEKSIKVNVRIIAATNKNLKELIGKGLFREDLYYRLAVLPLYIAPLRNRKSDIPPITEYFVEEYNKKYQMQKKMGDDAANSLLKFNWYGNIRELENFIQRLLINSDSNTISGADVVREMYKENISEIEEVRQIQREITMEENLKDIMANHEKSIIKKSLEEYKTTRKAAESLGITQAQLMRKKKKYSL
jgi:transcriptional regulator with PAS, ATPase and Fis domain